MPVRINMINSVVVDTSVGNFQVILAETMFTPGGTVSGSLLFSVTQPLPFRRVSIKIIGKETAHRKMKYSRYSRNNVHKEQVTLLGGLKGTDFKGELPPGDYNFPFAFVVPMNAPPTVSGIIMYKDHIMYNEDTGLTWFIKASIDTPTIEPSSIAVFTVTTAMPISQFQTRAPFSSPANRAVRTGCCFEQGVTVIQTNINQNMLIFGRDTSLDGNISINNSESNEDTKDAVVSLHRVCWAKVNNIIHINRTKPPVNSPYERTTMELIGTTTIQCNMKAGDGEKRFDFSIPLPNAPNLVSCYRGHNMFYYYRVQATCDGDTLFSTNIVASNALDESNRSPFIDVHTPGPIVPAKEYRRFVYAPPPGAQPSYPHAASGLAPHPTSTVPYMVCRQQQAPLYVVQPDEI